MNAPASGSLLRYCLDGRTATTHFPGVGRYVANLGRALAPLLEQRERLCILRDPDKPRLFEAFSELPENVEILDAPWSPFSLGQQWRIPALLKRVGAAVYHSPYTLFPYLTPVPTLLTVHDLIPLLFPEQSTRKARLFFSTALRLALRAAREVLAVSEQTRRDLEQRFRPRAVRVVPEAAAPHFRPAPAEAITKLRVSLGLPQTYALYLGSTKPHKNLAFLVATWLQHPMPWPLVVAGVRADHASELPDESSLRGRVLLLGPVDDKNLPTLYSGAELFIFPSLYEGFGLPILEAMACGTAVLCSNRASLPEVGGKAARYMDPLDAEALVGAVHELAASPSLLQTMREQSLARAADFSWSQTAAMTLATYRRLASAAV